MMTRECCYHALTHSGKFHADDVFAAALLLLLFPGIVIERENEIPEDYLGIAFDIGRGRFDHHQTDPKVREGGIIFSSFGLLWQEYGEDYIFKKLKQKHPETDFKNLRYEARYVSVGIDRELVKVIDAKDNSQFYNGDEEMKDYSIVNLISNLNPNWDENSSKEYLNKQFFYAVELAKIVIERETDKRIALYESKYYIDKAILNTSGHILVLNKDYPWSRHLAVSNNENAKAIWFVILPNLRGYFSIYIVKDQYGKRCEFPQEWLGKPREELDKIVPGFLFCHNHNFIASATSLQSALKITNLAIKKYMNLI